jgi:formylglycine-generating enzyme required for sulfatase activity
LNWRWARGGVRDEASATVQVRPPRVVTPRTEPAPGRKPAAKPASDVPTITSPIHLELVRIPAGEFLMGSDKSKDEQAFADEQPQHRLHVSDFYIGKYPVTNVQYAAFVKATKRKVPQC